MFDRAKWFLAGMSIALSVQLSQPVAAAVPVGKVVQTAQIGSSDAAQAVAAAKAAAATEALIKGTQLYQQGTAESLRSAIVKLEEALKLYREAGDRSGEATTLTWIGSGY